MYFVMQRSQQINQFFSEDLLKRNIISDFIFQKESLFAEVNLSNEELKIFEEVKSKFYEKYDAFTFKENKKISRKNSIIY